VIEKISVAWNDSADIGKHRRNCGEDKTNSHKMSSLVDAGTCTDHRKTLVWGRLEEGEVVGGCTVKDRVVLNPMPRRGRSKLADALVEGQRVGPEAERRYWKRTWYVQNAIPGGDEVSELAAGGERHLVGQRRGRRRERI
jgi:hypothetical protein